MHSSERERLLRETLQDADYEKYRSVTFAAGLSVLRQKQPPRPNWQPLAIAAAITFLLVVSLFYWRRTSRTQGVRLPETVPGVQVVVSVRDARLEVETSSFAAIETIETRALSVPVVSDDELLSLFPDQPVAFLRNRTKTEFMILGN